MNLVFLMREYPKLRQSNRQIFVLAASWLEIKSLSSSPKSRFDCASVI